MLMVYNEIDDACKKNYAQGKGPVNVSTPIIYLFEGREELQKYFTLL